MSIGQKATLLKLQRENKITPNVNVLLTDCLDGFGGGGFPFALRRETLGQWLFGEGPQHEVPHLSGEVLRGYLGLSQGI